MTPTELHAAVHAAVTARLELARAATPGPWEPDHPWLSDWINSERGLIVDCSGGQGYRRGSLADAEHIAANDPAAVIRACEADLETLAEHLPGIRPYVGSDLNMDRWWCELCDSESPCDELTRRARVYAVEVPDGT